MSDADLDNAAVAAALAEIGKLLQLEGENRYRVLAYEKAAKTVGGHTVSVAALARDGKLDELRGVGDALAQKIEELITTGSLQYLEDLRGRVPPTLLPLLELPGLGVKKVQTLWHDFGITSTDELRAALEGDRLKGASGFGGRTLQNIREALQRAHSGRVRLADALPLAQALVEGLRACPAVIRVSEAGSVRRRCETVHDLDLVASTTAPAAVADAFVALPEVVVRGSTKTTVELAKGLRADLRVVTDDEFPTTLVHFTGSKQHNVRLRERAKAAGMKISEYGVFRVDDDGGETERLDIPDEAAFFAAFDLAEIPPALREDLGEIEAAEAGDLPGRLVDYDDIAGVFHCHTTWSDGTASLEEMAAAARDLGWSYLGITDHSQTSVVAGGLKPEELEAQLEAIAAFNARIADDPAWRGFRLLSGTEVDILPDGALDFPDELLARLDLVVASVHSHLNQPRDEATARVLRALESPHVDVLGHATGRQLLKRDGSKVDLEAVIDKAAETGTIIELNASPRRLDMDWVHCRRAAERGVAIAITPDAHSPRALGHVRLGAEVARKAWLTPDQVINTRPWSDIAATLGG